MLKWLWWKIFPARWEPAEYGYDMRRKLYNGNYEYRPRTYGD